ncbi:MAG: hypothetical protein AAGJ46_14960 [Planctomycetota bacterium]
MGKIYFFLVGVSVGFGMHHLGMSYHFVQADDGLHVVPKLEAELDGWYVDVRSFTISDAARHVGLLAAIEHSDDLSLRQQLREKLLGVDAANALGLAPLAPLQSEPPGH